MRKRFTPARETLHAHETREGVKGKGGNPAEAVVRFCWRKALWRQDTFGNWLSEYCESGPALRESGGKLRESWESFAKSNGDDPGSAKSFAAKLKKRHYDQKRESDARYFLGLRLKVANDT